MPDLSHDSADDGFHEIQLSGKQLVFLFMATTVVAVVIFICGVLVGRDVRPTASAATQTSAALDTSPSPVTEPPASAPVSEDTPTPPAEDDLTYGRRLEENGKVSDKLKPEGTSSTPEPAPEPVARAAKAEPTPPPTPAPTPRVEARTAKTETPAAAAAATSKAGAPAASRSGEWIIQVAALRDRGAAASIAQRLSGKGYPAFVVNPSASSPAKVYRVQVGRYDERRDAEQVARRLEKEEKLSSWISR